LRKVQDAASPWLRPWIEAAVLTGWRLREQAELRWADVNEDWIFHRGQGKVPRVKARPVNRELADLLKRQRKAHGGGPSTSSSDSTRNPF
jgi:integrase